MKLGISQDNLRKWNGIQGNRILVGQKLKYLGESLSTRKARGSNEQGSAAEAAAETGEVSSESSKDETPSKSPTLVAGTSIELPAPEPSKGAEKQYYLIKGGDSLWDIAVKYRSTVQRLKELNGQLPTVLKPGTRIRVK